MARGMALRTGLGIGLGLVMAAMTAGGQVVAYTQPADPNGGQYKSAWYAPDGLDSDEYVWDAFTLGSTTAITEVRWRGAYTNYLSGAGRAPVYDFDVKFYGSIGNFQPDIVNGPLRTYHVHSNAGETQNGSAGGVIMYDYSYTLPTSFMAVGGTKYWVQLEAYQGLTPTYYWPPDWSIARGTGGENQHFRKIGGTGGQYATITGDCAFTLMTSGAAGRTISVTAMPDYAGAVAGGGVYPNGTNATVTATANAGYGFVNWTENGSQVSSNWQYTFNVTRDRALVAHFVDAYTIQTTSWPLYGGEASGGGVFNAGSTVTVTAAARQGYLFDSWTDGGAVVSNSPVYSFPAGATATLVANFVPGPTTVTFDLDSGDPPPHAQLTSTPFDNTVNGLWGHFSSPQDFGGFPAFSLQSEGTTFVNQFHLENNFLWPDSVYRNDLAIRFGRSVTSVSLDFATVEMEAWADWPSPVVVTAYMDGTLVGSAQAAGVYGLGTTYPEGYVSFVSATPFNRVTVAVGWNQFGTNNFMSDNITVEVACLADFNGDGFVDFFDIDAYVACFEGVECPAGKTADFNADGFVDFFDYDAFVNAFEIGC